MKLSPEKSNYHWRKRSSTQEYVAIAGERVTITGEKVVIIRKFVAIGGEKVTIARKEVTITDITTLPTEK